MSGVDVAAITRSLIEREGFMDDDGIIIGWGAGGSCCGIRNLFPYRGISAINGRCRRGAN